jgi:hypothetical protein
LDFDGFVHERAVGVDPLVAGVEQAAIGAGVLRGGWSGWVVRAALWRGEVVGVHQLSQSVL